MRGGTASRWILAPCLLMALLIFPAIAQAQEVTGTVTAADTGAKMLGIEISAYYRVGNNVWSTGSVFTDADGQYTLDFNPGVDTVFFTLHATDATGTYNASTSVEATIGVGETRNVDLVMNRDTRSPMVSMYLTSGQSIGLSDLVAAGDALPPGIGGYSAMSDGSGDVEITADDSWYRYDRNWGYSDGSGIGNVSYSVDGRPWVTTTPEDSLYTSWYGIRPLWTRIEVPMPAEGLHTFSFKAVDKNGNSSSNRSGLVLVDKTPPVTTYDKRTATTKRIKLVASDALTGVGATFARIGASGAFAYRTTITVPSSGSKHVEYYSVDKVGNAEQVKDLTVSAPAGLSTPKPSATSVGDAQSFTVSGSVFGRSAATGYIRVYKLNHGVYRFVSKKPFTEGSDGKYRVSLNLRTGTYKVRATYGGYSATWANPPVTSKLSKKISVR